MVSELALRLRIWLVASVCSAIVLTLFAGHAVTGERVLPFVAGQSQDGVVMRRLPVLPDILQRERLIVLTRNGPSTYYTERDEPAGFEHDLARAYADWLGVETEFRVYDNSPKLFDALAKGEGHLIAANLIAGDVPADGPFALGPAYDAVRQQLVCHRNAPTPKSKAELHKASITVVAEPSYEGRLRYIGRTLPGLKWKTMRGLSTEDLMQRVADRSIGCTVGDSTTVSLNRRYYPDLSVPFDLSGPEPMSWVIAAHGKKLKASLDLWFDQPGTKKILKALQERYYGHVPDYDYVDLLYFSRRIKERLPRYKKTFRQEAERHGLPWTLLAAMGYQESHWRPHAKSPTGVRGLMMLTRPTARELGVKNRLNPVQSIRGGAKYLARLIKRVPDTVRGENRLWFAIAAYNVGFGHMMDARKLAARLGRNPDSWTDLKVTLPLLTQRAFYSTLTHGYARGNEPVRYVQRVRHYQDILERQFTVPNWDQVALLEPDSSGP